jgi:hypothetical protein
MRTRNDLERLDAAGRPLLADADSLVDAAEQDRILERILVSDRPRVDRPARMTPRRRVAFLLVGVVLAAAVVAVALVGRGNRPASPSSRGHHQLALTGATIQLSGYRFRTPAGFKSSTSTCGAPATAAGNPRTITNGFAAAASADGGCVEAAYLIAPSTAGGSIPVDAQPVDVGQYQGYFVPQDSSGGSALYVELPKAGGSSGNHVYLVLLSQGLTEDQLIAVAQSGLPD